MTPLGYVMLPFGLACFLFSERWMFRLVVFWTLFSASSAINFGDPQSGSALQLWMFFGFLWLLQRGITRLHKLSFAIDRRILLPCAWLASFAFVACASLLMPLYINGRLLISSPILGDLSETALHLTSHNFTQFLYLIFGCLIAINVAHLSLIEEERRGAEKTILFSAIFVCLWGMVNFFCNVTGTPYPSYLFNNSISPYAGGFLETLNSGIGRISSTALEPSIFAQSIVTVLPLTIPAWLGKGFVLSPWVDRFSSLFLLLLLALSTSSTGYIGTIVLAVLLVAALMKTRLLFARRPLWTIAFVGASLTLAIGIALRFSEAAREIATSMLLEKSASGSALERIMTITQAFGYFKQYPILGVGWGSVTSHDLFMFLLSNAGIIGAATFTTVMLTVLLKNWGRLNPSVEPFDPSRFSWFLSLAVFLVTSAGVEFPLVMGNFWLILGMAIGTGWQQDKGNN
jgi:hypothetical protein